MEGTLLDFFALVNKVYLDIPISGRIAYIGWFIYATLYYFLRRFENYNGLVKERTLVKNNKPFTMYVLLVLSAAIILYCSTNSLEFKLPTAPGVAYEMVGFALMAVGLLVAMEARASLNGFWGGGIFSYPNESDNVFVRHGLYEYIRHPIYFGQILLTIGTALMVNNYLVSFLPLLTIVSNILRAKAEENDLSKRFGDEFEDYKNKSDFIIPFVW